MEMRLMIETEPPQDGRGSSRDIIAANHKYWRLSDPLDISSDTLPPYACASYVWGDGRRPNPIHPSISMSDRTLATFAAVARHAPGRAIWIDAFCVPIEPSARRPTLESLGFIFSRAQAVVAVISRDSIDAIREMKRYVDERRRGTWPKDRSVDAGPLETLEKEMWVRSVWTYQEVVNCPGKLLFASPHEEDEPIDSMAALNALGEYMALYEGNTIDTPKPVQAMTHPYRHVLDFEGLLADWIKMEYQSRSALLIMTGLNFRQYVAPANYFYSMIGALTAKASKRATNPTVEDLAERFMELCEEKGDYSFIFSSVQRDTRPGLRWRPLPGILKSILPWHSDGEGQPGRKTEEGVMLEDVMVLAALEHNEPTLTEKTRMFLRESKWMRDLDEEDSAITVHRALTDEFGFTGVGGWFTVEGGGVFYAQDKLPARDIVVSVSRQVQWCFGAAAIARAGDGDNAVYMPGVFVGNMSNVVNVSEFLIV